MTQRNQFWGSGEHRKRSALSTQHSTKSLRQRGGCVGL